MPVYHIKSLILFLSIGFSFASAASVRIMPFGDSITYDNRHNEDRPTGLRTGYRVHLYNLLKKADLNFDFVGSVRAGQDVRPRFDPDNEGHPGEDNTYLAAHVYNFLSINPADIILIHSGTNHHSNLNLEINAMKHMLDEIDRYESDNNTPVRVVLAQIIPRKNDLFITLYNNELAVLAYDRIVKGDNIILVDMENEANLQDDDWHDGTHPNDKGYAKMAPVWVDPILKKRKDNLYTFPISLVKRSHIINASIDESSNTISFSTTIPNDGIQF